MGRLLGSADEADTSSIPLVRSEMSERATASGRRAIGLDPNRLDHSWIRKLTKLENGLLDSQEMNRGLASMGRRQKWELLDSDLIDAATGQSAYVCRQSPVIGGQRGDRWSAMRRIRFRG